MRKILAITGLAMLLSGCGEKGDFEKAINAKISHSKLCYSLANQGLLDVSQQANGFSSVDVLEVTDKGQAVEFWDRKDGACVGHRAVAEIPCSRHRQCNSFNKIPRYES